MVKEFEINISKTVLIFSFFFYFLIFHLPFLSKKKKKKERKKEKALHFRTIYKCPAVHMYIARLLSAHTADVVYSSESFSRTSLRF